MTSGRLYSLVTKSWPRIAAGLVVVIGLVELVVGGMRADSGLELYLLAWGAMTGGIWFLFEKAESSVSPEVRKGVTNWFRSEDIRARSWAIPEQFAALFDLLFTERHWSRECFYRSCLASSAAVIIGFTLKLGFGAWAGDPSSGRLGVLIVTWAGLLWLVLVAGTLVVKSRRWRLGLGMVFLGLVLAPYAMAQMPGRPLAALVHTASLAWTVLASAVVLNFIPDYASLLQTRWAIRWAARTGRLWRLVAFDALATALISLLFVGMLYAGVVAPEMGRSFAFGDLLVSVLWPPPLLLSEVPSDVELLSVASAAELPDLLALRARFTLSLLSICFYSAFFTSGWLWLYVLGTVLARLLVRMKSGVGFLLRVTDVENQPFRSVGFVSVLIVSGLFALGLPFVLL